MHSAMTDLTAESGRGSQVSERSWSRAIQPYQQAQLHIAGEATISKPHSQPLLVDWESPTPTRRVMTAGNKSLEEASCLSQNSTT